jgi:hypothetical protein
VLREERELHRQLEKLLHQHCQKKVLRVTGATVSAA